MPTYDDEDSSIPVRILNEYAYCPRLAYLEWVQGEWRDNLDTIQGTISHQRVDQASGSLAMEQQDYREAVQAKAVTMSSDTLRLTAKMDLVETEADQVVPIEFKKARRPESGPYLSDQIQVAAQALILRDNGYAVHHAAIYYVQSKLRVDVPLTEELIGDTLRTIDSVRALSQMEVPPPALEDSPKCPRCSLVGICLPDETNLLKTMSQDEGAPPKTRRLVPSLDVKHPLYLTQAGTTLGRSGDRLIVKDHGDTLQEVRVRELDHVAVFGNIQLSTQTLQRLAEHAIPVTYFSSGGWFYGYTLSTVHKNVLLRRAQFRASDDPAAALSIARDVIFGKISNSRTLLRRDARGLPDDVLTTLKNLATHAKVADSIPQLIGIEGAAARLYFQNFSRLLKHELPFDWSGRNRRPPKDPINALLSLGYALLTKQMVVCLTAIGLDPFMGFLHQPKYGKPALALDMIEEFRPLIVDSIVMTVLNTGEVAPEHFISRNGSTALTNAGRKAFLSAFERRLNTEVTHPIFGYRVSYRRILEVQGRLLSRQLLGEIKNYPTFRTR